jgi:hypothetical protein
MKKQFYSHVVETESLVVKLERLNLKEDEKAHLLSLMESSLHHVILDAILSELSADDKKLFLKGLASEDHDAVWTFLKKKIDNIEGKIEKAADDLKKELHSDIDEIEK